MNAAIVLSGSVILHEYVHSIRPMQVIYYAPPPPGTSSLSYLLDMEHRKNTTRKLSDLLSNLVCEDLVVDGDQEQKRREHQEMHSKLKARLFPVIFTLYHFFEEFRRLLLEHEVARIKETSSTTSSHKSFAIELSGSEIVDQRVLMQRYPPSMVEHLYSAFMLITKVLLKHVAPSQSMFFPSRMDRDGQRRRAREELGIPLVLGGMDKVYDFLKIGISSGPFKPSCPVKTWTNGLYPSPTKNSQWQRNWEKLGITSRGFQVSKVPQLTVRVPNLDRILVHAACDLIIWNALGIDLATWLAANPPIFMPSPAVRRQIRYLDGRKCRRVHHGYISERRRQPRWARRRRRRRLTS